MLQALKCKRNKNELAARRAFVAHNDLTGEIHMLNVTRRAAGSSLLLLLLEGAWEKNPTRNYR